MNKVYGIYNYIPSWGEFRLEGVILGLDKANKYVLEKNELGEEERIQFAKCSECYEDCRESMYILRNECDKANIKTDRHGEYCENALSGSQDLIHGEYSIEEIDILA